MGRVDANGYVCNEIHCLMMSGPQYHMTLKTNLATHRQKSSVNSVFYFTLKYAIWDLGREMFTKLRFGSRSKKFGNRWHGERERESDLIKIYLSFFIITQSLVSCNVHCDSIFLAIFTVANHFVTTVYCICKECFSVLCSLFALNVTYSFIY